MFVVDNMNNVRRRCTVRGVPGYRVWRVVAAVSGRRYMVRHMSTGEYRTVARDLLTSLY